MCKIKIISNKRYIVKSLSIFSEELSKLPSKFKINIPSCGGCINFSNTARRGERKYFTLSFDALRSTFSNILSNKDEFYQHRYYIETAWRILGNEYITEETSYTMIGVQTKAFYVLLNKITHVASGRSPESYEDDSFNMRKDEIENASRMLNELML